MILFLTILLTLDLGGVVPPVCGARLDGTIAHHFCNVEGPYTVRVSSPVRFRYGEQVLDAGTHVLTFTGPEQVDRIVEPLE